MRIILTGGGTGGHIYPALAIGEAIKKEWPEAEFLYVGSKAGLENKIVPATDFPFTTVDVIGWQRRLSLQTLKTGWKALVALRQAERIIREFAPGLVIGTGGYVCLPVVLAATWHHIPTLIHEQNAVPGLANRFLAKRVKGVLLTFSQSKKHFPPSIQKNLHETGLPVRPNILQVSREEGLKYLGLKKDKKNLLVVGGSRGARSINKAMIRVYKKLAGHPEIQIIHLTGPAEFETVKDELFQEGIGLGNSGNIIIKPYLHEMEYALSCADLCVARAGAAFLSEMTVKGIPGILIPYPWAAENHQEHNARSLVEAKAAVMLLERELTGDRLLEEICKILFHDKKRREMAVASTKAGKPEAIEKILQIIRQYL